MDGMIRRALASISAKLRPTGDELYRLVVMEGDPAYAERFEQLTPGPTLAVLGLAAIALFALVSAPFRLIGRYL
jgi:hypothetical protein